MAARGRRAAARPRRFVGGIRTLDLGACCTRGAADTAGETARKLRGQLPPDGCGYQ